MRISKICPSRHHRWSYKYRWEAVSYCIFRGDIECPICYLKSVLWGSHWDTRDGRCVRITIFPSLRDRYRSNRPSTTNLASLPPSSSSFVLYPLPPTSSEWTFSLSSRLFFSELISATYWPWKIYLWSCRTCFRRGCWVGLLFWNLRDFFGVVWCFGWVRILAKLRLHFSGVVECTSALLELRIVSSGVLWWWHVGGNRGGPSDIRRGCCRCHPTSRSNIEERRKGLCTRPFSSRLFRRESEHAFVFIGIMKWI